MMFRKLYWVTEELKESDSMVTGVYTSIPDLVNHGLRWTNGKGEKFRLSLVKLDCNKEPLGVWTSPSFDGLETRLEDFIKTDEFTVEECKLLQQSLDEFVSTTV